MTAASSTAATCAAARAPPSAADAQQGFTPVGALAELGAPAFDWALNDRDPLWADDVAELAEQATRAQWDASRDVPWAAARDLPDHMERAVAQVMTFIAQNEYAALYVPAAFLPHVNPRLRGGRHVARRPHPRRGPPHRGLHQARARSAATPARRWPRPSCR